MKLSELKNIIDKSLAFNKNSGDCDVVVRIHKPNSVGGTPSVDVRNVSLGFDWDVGKFLITPDIVLVKASEK